MFICTKLTFLHSYILNRDSGTPLPLLTSMCTWRRASIVNFVNMENLKWSELICKIGLKEVNELLDKRFKAIFTTLRDHTSVCTNDKTLIERLQGLKDEWLPARDQYERSVIHLASYHGNTRLVRCLIYSGCPVNVKDGIRQKPLTLAHMGHRDTVSLRKLL